MVDQVQRGCGSACSTISGSWFGGIPLLAALDAQAIKYNRPGFHPGVKPALKLHFDLADRVRLEFDHAFTSSAHEVMVFARISRIKTFLPPFLIENSRADQVFLFQQAQSAIDRGKVQSWVPLPGEGE